MNRGCENQALAKRAICHRTARLYHMPLDSLAGVCMPPLRDRSRRSHAPTQSGTLYVRCGGLKNVLRVKTSGVPCTPAATSLRATPLILLSNA